MQIGNRAALESERLALRDAFDAVWLGESTLSAKGSHAVHCAMLLSHCEFHHSSPNWIIGKGWRLTGPEVILAGTENGAGDESLAMLSSFGDTLASALQRH